MSVKVDEFKEIIDIVKVRVHDLATVGGYGHIGDGNIHINVTAKTPAKASEVEKLLYPYVLEEVGKRKGSISAEHGIGYAKAKYLHLSKSKDYIETMKAVKKALDPNWIMNPGKIFAL